MMLEWSNIPHHQILLQYYIIIYSINNKQVFQTYCLKLNCLSDLTAYLLRSIASFPKLIFIALLKCRLLQNLIPLPILWFFLPDSLNLIQSPFFIGNFSSRVFSRELIILIEHSRRTSLNFFWRKIFLKILALLTVQHQRKNSSRNTRRSVPAG